MAQVDDYMMFTYQLIMLLQGIDTALKDLTYDTNSPTIQIKKEDWGEIQARGQHVRECLMSIVVP